MQLVFLPRPDVAAVFELCFFLRLRMRVTSDNENNTRWLRQVMYIQTDIYENAKTNPDTVVAPRFVQIQF